MGQRRYPRLPGPSRSVGRGFWVDLDAGIAHLYDVVVSRIHPTAVLAVVVVGVVLMYMAMRHSHRRGVTQVRVGELPATTHGMEVEGNDLHLRDWNAWMKDASGAIETSMKEVGTDPVGLATNVFRRLFPDRPWPPPQGSEFSDKWELIVRAIATAVKRPLPASLEVVE